MTDAPGISRILTLVFTDLADSTAPPTDGSEAGREQTVLGHVVVATRPPADRRQPWIEFLHSTDDSIASRGMRPLYRAFGYEFTRVVTFKGVEFVGMPPFRIALEDVSLEISFGDPSGDFTSDGTRCGREPL